MENNAKALLNGCTQNCARGTNKNINQSVELEGNLPRNQPLDDMKSTQPLATREKLMGFENKDIRHTKTQDTRHRKNTITTVNTQHFYPALSPDIFKRILFVFI